MATILYMTVSRDGFIADATDGTPWGEASWQAFGLFVLTCDIVLVGRRTYEIMRDQKEFIEGPKYILVTSDPGFETDGLQKLDIKSKADMPVAETIGIIGGGDLNGRLAKMGVIDEIYLDVEPIDLGSGTKLFGTHDPQLKLEHLGSRQLGKDGTQRHFRVVK